MPLLAATAAPARADDKTSRLPSPTSGAARSALDAFTFLQKATDAYATSGLRLVQSFGSGYIGDAGLLQDNAVTCIALLAAGDWTRARAVGDALLLAQDHDPEHDGRLRRGYAAGHLVHADGSIDLNPGFGYITGGTDTGSMAWAGLALAHLARRTGRAQLPRGATTHRRVDRRAHPVRRRRRRFSGPRTAAPPSTRHPRRSR